MMTAEQFWQYWDDKKWAKPSPEIVKPVCVAFAEAYHRAEPAAQLAEKEREIALSQQFAAQLESNIKFLNERVAAAEERLKEAQAQLDALKELLTDMELEHSAALREREAELEQRWIAVGERLPECGTCLMVYVYDRKDERKVSWQDLATYSYHGGWSVGSPIEPDLVVTHWQPLPSPPKESAKNVGERSTI